MNKQLLHLGTSTFRQVVTMGVALWSTPLLIRYLGSDAFGAYRSIFEFLGFLGILEAGIYGALLGHLLNAYAQGDLSRAGAIAREGLQKNIRSLLIILGLGLLLWPVYARLTRPEGISNNQVLICYLLVLANFIFLPGNIHRAWLEVRLQGHFANMITLIQGLATTLIGLAMAALGLGINSQAIGVLAGMILGHALLFFKAKDIWRLSPAKDFRAEMGQTQKYSTMNEAANKISFQMDYFIISAILSFKEVTLFFGLSRIFQLATTQLQFISNASWAALGAHYHAGRSELFASGLIKSTQRIAAIAASCAAGLYLLNPYFVRWWLGAEFISGKSMHAGLALNMFYLSILTLWGWCFIATQKQKDLFPLKIAQALTNLIASLTLTKLVGIPGPVLGSAITSFLVTQGGMLYLLKRNYKIGPIPLLFSIHIPLLINCILIFAAEKFLPEGILPRAIYCALIFVVNGTIFLRDDLKRIFNFLKDRF